MREFICGYQTFLTCAGEVIGFALLVIVGLFVLLLWAAQAIKQRLCKHARVGESRSCEAICNACGKNLGFIGAWREKQYGRSRVDPEGHARDIKFYAGDKWPGA